jgi:nucleotide-binding universal stress UspA family protein
MFKKILIPIDGSKHGYKALKFGSEFARNYDNVEIVVFSVIRHHSFAEGSLSMLKTITTDAAENLDEIYANYAKEIVEKGKSIVLESGIEAEKVRGYVRFGQVEKEILKFAKNEQIDLIIIGKKGHNKLTGYLLGGTSHKITGLAHCPVLVV